ncbi:MAG TPA: aminotransferase class III-fold pyridoxal phosphate-dependent enzyme [Puia sp.]|nr:aminotransferase class III-fold pyridoxal phosphate-dependent enzyme [Puia sp.]
MEVLQPKLKRAEKDEILQDNLDHTLFSWSKQRGINPINVKKAEGLYLYDHDGNKYLDFSSGLVNVNIGHGNPRVIRAVVDQMQEVAYVAPSCITKVRGLLGKKLAEISPGDLNRTFFTLCGASAVENAIKLARIYTGRYKVLGRYRAYHGSTYGAMSASGDPRKLDDQKAPNFIQVEDPYCYRCPWGQQKGSCTLQCVAHLQRIVEFEGPDKIAAIIMEGESGSSGCITYPPGYLAAVRSICDQHGILLIADEVMSGFGRTGKWFGVDNYGVIPDMIATAKGITAAYLPLGALIVSEKIASYFDDKVLMLGMTYSAHATCCAAALEVLQIYEDEGLLQNAADMGVFVTEQAALLQKKHPCIGDVRITGLLGCLELVKNRETKEPMAPYNAKPSEMGVMNRIGAALRDMGMYVFIRWNYLFIAPPLTITREEMQQALAKISKALEIADAECY